MKAFIEDISSGQRFELNKDIFKYPPVKGDMIRFSSDDSIYVYIITNKFVDLLRYEVIFYGYEKLL